MEARTSVNVTQKPFGVSGSVSVDDSVFDANRDDFLAGAESEIRRLGEQLFTLAVNEYDRRNARSE